MSDDKKDNKENAESDAEIVEEDDNRAPEIDSEPIDEKDAVIDGETRTGSLSAGIILLIVAGIVLGVVFIASNVLSGNKERPDDTAQATIVSENKSSESEQIDPEQASSEPAVFQEPETTPPELEESVPVTDALDVAKPAEALVTEAATQIQNDVADLKDEFTFEPVDENERRTDEARRQAEERIRQRQLEREAAIAAATGIVEDVVEDAVEEVEEPTSADVETDNEPTSVELESETAEPEPAEPNTVTGLTTSVQQDELPPTETPSHSENQEDFKETVAALVEEKVANNIESIRESVKAELLQENNALLQRETETQQRITAQLEEMTAMRDELAETLQVRDEQANQRIAELESKIIALENENRRLGNSGLAQALALDRLEASLLQGNPYSNELQQAEQLLPDTREFDVLRRDADTGVITLRSLQSAYPSVARKTLAHIRRNESGGIWSGIGTSLSNLFNVRRVGDVSGDTPSATLARAEVRLADGDLAAALGELDKLPDDVGDDMIEWRNKAEQHQEVVDALDSLQTRLLRNNR